MKRIAITGATGFLGRYIVRELIPCYSLQCWYRRESDRSGFEGLEGDIQWIEGQLGDNASSEKLIDGCDALIHSALYHPGGGFRGGHGDLLDFAKRNIIGSLMLFEAAQKASLSRVVFVSTCAVHEKILPDRPLDEAHPLWATSHYGAHKAAIEKFVHSYGFGAGLPICAIRPTGIYGMASDPKKSKWYELIQQIVNGKEVTCSSGGKEVHAADVAKAIRLLLEADTAHITGEAFSCYDRYISEFEVAELAKHIAGSSSRIDGMKTSPKNQIETAKITKLGMTFGGEELLKETITAIVDSIRRSDR
ncbi:MAG: NAD(P)-dependent oxidoreductase [Deltaproteobacteria bacterium]|nr:NAD(P)-dependent oxidoreductase [Deltaproteobacteria bacterium]